MRFTGSITTRLHLAAPTTRVAAPLASAGRFDRRAIMIEAVRLARTAFRTLDSWRVRMAAGLILAWKRAREARNAAPAPLAPVQPRPVAPRSISSTPRVRTFVRGSRLYSHGW